MKNSFYHVHKIVPFHQVGDSGGILGVAKAGGVGIAFNYNQPLKDFIEREIAGDVGLKEKIKFVEPKSASADLRRIISYL